MEMVTAYKASDGALFALQSECSEHEISLLWRTRIDEFAASGMSPYPSGAQSAMCRKVIIAWENFKSMRGKVADEV